MRAISPFSSFLRDKRGTTAIFFGLVAVPSILMLGMAIDLGRAQVAKSRLSASIDSAALAIGRIGDASDSELQALADSFVDANFPAAFGDAHPVEFTTTSALVTMTGTATVPMTFMRLLGVDELTVATETEVRRAETALMVSLVLDVTGSMWSNNNIGALRTAALDLSDILFGDLEVNENLRVSIVPYAASVNPGAEAATLVASEPSFGPPGSTDLLGWKGCVVERAGTLSIDDTAPGAGAWWEPYRYPVDLDNRWVEGDVNSVEPGPVNSNGLRGPNLGCPNPILPLNKTRADVDATLSGLSAWNRGGTLTDIGIAWGIRTLSPGEPFDQSTEIDPQTGDTLWDSFRWQRAIVIMTDGDSLFFKLNGNANPTNNPAPPSGYTRPANTPVASNLTDFTGYGRLGEAHATSIVGTTSTSTAKTNLNTRIEGLCTTAKAQGIIVYTVVFTSGVSTSVRDMYQRCASDPGKYWYAPNQGALRAAFNQIGDDLIRLRVSR